MSDIFLYGTLCDRELLQIVLGRPLGPDDLHDAELPGYRLAAVKGQSFPMLVPDPDARAKGRLLVGVQGKALKRLRYYEDGHGYTLAPVCPRLGDGRERHARAFMPASEGWQPAGRWSLAEWRRKEGPLVVETAREIMAHYGMRPPREVFENLQTARQRAWSRIAARDHAPVSLRRKFGRADIDVQVVERPYLGYFAVEETVLRHRRYDGGMSDSLRRAVFLPADAVTVLPYDPRNDLVLLIEQFRAGPLGRGDPHPWCLEPVAGRRDPGEGLEECARREMVEETGVIPAALERIAGYYSTPGAVSEYLVSFVALCDLDADKAGVHGLDAEHEDIRSLIVPFSALMEAVRSGEAENGPLLISALWLERERDRLRRECPK